MSFTSFLDPVLGPVMSISSPWNLVLISFILTAIITLAYKFLTDQKLMKEIKQEMKDLQKRMKEVKDNPTEAMVVQKQIMEKTIKQMTQSIKPTLVTFVPIIFIFTWLRGYYEGLGSPDVLFGLSWFWSYFIVTIILSISMRKLLKVH
tara:strand:+ start:1725 stop:2168 length:444 start_codon:yes stop_codon:yes gene_type:complete